MNLSAAAILSLGEFLTGTEARGVADRLDAGESLSAAARTVPQARRAEFRELVRAAEVDHEMLIMVLRGIEGARGSVTSIEPMWTMPGHLAQTGSLTGFIPRLIEQARMSVICATFNFQESSQLWDSLQLAAARPEIALRVYIDTSATTSSARFRTPGAGEIARQLHPGAVLRTKKIDGRMVRSHAKFIAVDHRFLLVTSANFSRSAEYHNVEFGVLIDNIALTESVERQMAAVEEQIYERVDGRAQTGTAS